jgi:hypothetical protein
MEDDGLLAKERELTRGFARRTTGGSKDVYSVIMKLKVREVQIESHRSLLGILRQHASSICSILGLDSIESISSIKLKIFDSLEVLGIYITDNLGNNYWVAIYDGGFHLQNTESLGLYSIVSSEDNRLLYERICADLSSLSGKIDEIMPLLREC